MFQGDLQRVRIAGASANKQKPVFYMYGNLDEAIGLSDVTYSVYIRRCVEEESPFEGGRRDMVQI